MATLFEIICKTHLHAGSGDSNFGVIDKLVQRDPTNELPCIYASSLKGAFREYWEEKLKKESEANQIFGDYKKGVIIFHQAFLISIPLRSNPFPYFNITSPIAIDSIIDQNKLFETNLNVDELISLKALKQDGKIIVFENNTANLSIEGYDVGSIVKNTSLTMTDKIKKIFGERIAIVDDSIFKQLCSDYNLPVIARNHLENGQSNNLWYEQIIPRESHFFFAVSITPGEDMKAENFFDEMNVEKLIQIGANATIGYGQCLISKILLS